jgi:hypothetical protein
MTEQRKLKKRVRERAARTGESYITARRQVVAAGGHAAPGAPSTDTANTAPGEQGPVHRESALLARMLRQAGVTAPHTGSAYSEVMLAGLAGGIGFLYAVFEYKGHPPTMTIVAQHHPQPWLPTALDHLGLPYHERRSTSVANAMADLRGSGRPAYCDVDRGRLPWHGSGSWLYADPYGVLVEVDGETAAVDDGWSTHELSTEDFAAAWSGHTKGRHYRLGLADGAADTAVDLPAAVSRAVRLTVSHLTGPVLGNSFDVNFGLRGMAKLAAQLRDTRTRTGWAKRYEGHLDRAMRRLDECLDREYTAPGATRPVYAAFLVEAATVQPVPQAGAMRAAAEIFDESGRTWSRIAAVARETDAAERLPELAGLVDDARALEERAVAVLAATHP